jgi:hypothetical protein
VFWVFLENSRLLVVVTSALFILIGGSGGLVVRLLFPELRRRWFVALAAGLSLLHVATLSGAPLWAVLSAVGALAILEGLLRVREGWRPAWPTGAARRLLIALTIVCLPLWVYFLVRPLWGFDARNLWFFQGRIIYLDGAFPFSDWSKLICHPGPQLPLCPHPDYPKLVPILAALVATLFGFWNEYLPKLCLIILQVVELIALIELGWRVRAVLLAAVMTAVMPYRFFFDSASLDIHVGLLTLIAILAFGRRSSDTDATSAEVTNDSLIALAALGLMTQLKMEGRVIAVVVLTCVLLTRVRRWGGLVELWRGLWFFVPAIVWAVESRFLHIRSYFEQSGVASLAISRLRHEYLPVLLPGIVNQTPTRSGLVVFGVALVASRWVSSAKPRFAQILGTPSVRLGLTALVGIGLAQSLAYLISPYQSAYAHLINSANRTTLSMEAALLAAAMGAIESSFRFARAPEPGST